MMMRSMDLVHSFLPLVSIATFWCVMYAQSDTDGPSNTYPVECGGRQYTRHWWTSMWGFIVTLVVFTMDVWGVMKSEDENTVKSVFETFFMSALNPLYILCGSIWQTIHGMAMLGNLREGPPNDVVAPLYPWRKSHIKIILGCPLIVNLSPDVHKEVHKFNAFEDKVYSKDLSEALVIGPKVANSKQFNVELRPHGELALLRSNVLPPYDELKFLRGNSSLGMTIASAQAIGYIYGVVVRCVQGLQVSPIEAIVCILNIVILMKGVLHNFASLGHRPLLLYLLPEEEAKFVEECKKIQYFKFEIGGRFKLIVLIACSFLLAVGAYFVVDFLKSLKRTCVVPIILFEVSLLLGGVFAFRWATGRRKTFFKCLMFLIVSLNLVGYVWALFVTFKYWKKEKFDIQSFNYLSKCFPI